jgi:hypothetical protein
MRSWSSQAHRRLETVRTVITERGLRANGYIIDASDTPYGSSYSLLVDVRGRTRRLAVQSDSIDGERHLALTRTPGGPWVVESTAGSSPLYALDDAQDVDLDSSAFTNALALRRLALATENNGGLQLGQDIPVTVACISMPTLAVRAIQHVYTFRGDGVVSYRGPAGEADLTIDQQNFVIDFPGLSRRLG